MSGKVNASLKLRATQLIRHGNALLCERSLSALCHMFGSCIGSLNVEHVDHHVWQLHYFLSVDYTDHVS